MVRVLTLSRCASCFVVSGLRWSGSRESSTFAPLVSNVSCCFISPRGRLFTKFLMSTSFEEQLSREWVSACAEIIACDIAAERLWRRSPPRRGFFRVVCYDHARLRQLYETGQIPNRSGKSKAVFPRFSWLSPPSPENPNLHLPLINSEHRKEALRHSEPDDVPENPNLALPFTEDAPLKQVACDLKRSQKQVKRCLDILAENGITPIDWRNSGRWSPQPWEASQMIRNEFSAISRQPKGDTAARRMQRSPYEDWMLKLRNRKLKAEKKLASVTETERLIKLFRNTYLSAIDCRIACREFNKICDEYYEFAGAIFEENGPEAFAFQAAFYAANLEESQTPRRRVKELLKLNHSAYWRQFGHDHPLVQKAEAAAKFYHQCRGVMKTPLELLSQLRDYRNEHPAQVAESESSAAWDKQVMEIWGIRGA